MSWLPCIIAVLCSTVAVQAFDCSQACDLLGVDAPDTSLMYQISVDNIQYHPGSRVQVMCSGHNDTYPFRGVLLQAKGLGSFDAVGVMTLPGAQQYRCGQHRDNGLDTVCLTSNGPLGAVRATWQPPKTAGEIRHVEIQAIFMDLDGGMHRQHSIQLTENVTIVEEPEKQEVDLHNERTEVELVIIQKEKDQKLIDLENLATEDDHGGFERREREQHQKEIHWEETQYEMALKEEEDRIRARIQAELKDKEEYDRLKFEREQREREEREREREREEREREQREREREERERERKEREREENNTINKNPDEIDLGEDKASGSPRIAILSAVTMVFSALVLTL